MSFSKLRPKQEKIGEFCRFLEETSKIGESMENRDSLPGYPKRAVVARRLIESRGKSKLLSGTGKTSVMVTPDGVSIVFQSVKLGHTIHWPVSDWSELKRWMDLKVENDTNPR